jgi:hypothetical protein
MRNFFRLVLFWPRCIGNMIGQVLQSMPVTIDQQARRIHELEMYIQRLEAELLKTRLELDKRKPGGFRIVDPRERKAE